MTKSQFLKYYAKHMGISQKAAREHFDGFTLTLEKTIEAGEEINLTGFGKFSVTNDAKKESKVTFKASPQLIKKVCPA